MYNAVVLQQEELLMKLEALQRLTSKNALTCHIKDEFLQLEKDLEHLVDVIFGEIFRCIDLRRENVLLKSQFEDEDVNAYYSILIATIENEKRDILKKIADLNQADTRQDTACPIQTSPFEVLYIMTTFENDREKIIFLRKALISVDVKLLEESILSDLEIVRQYKLVFNDDAASVEDVFGKLTQDVSEIQRPTNIDCSENLNRENPNQNKATVQHKASIYADNEFAIDFNEVFDFEH
jgi:hypothetical protein